MIQRKTQTAEYWQAFSLTPADIEFLRNLLLDAERPADHPRAGPGARHRALPPRRSRTRAPIWHAVSFISPRSGFAVGDKSSSPRSIFASARSWTVRPGENPEYGDFDVITVDFGPRPPAAQLSPPG